jgi:signal peptidase I
MAEGTESSEDTFMRDLYATLGVSRTATTDEIREAYWRQVRFHSMGDEPGERLRELREAYETLSDPARRAEYDSAPDDGFGTTATATGTAATAAATLPGIAVPEPADGQPTDEPKDEPKHSRNPLDRLTARLPRPWRVAVDWIVTIAGAILIVLAIKQWVVNPYRIPSSSMEPTLHCAKPGPDCEARLSDRVLANRFIYHFRSPHRGEIIVFNTPKARAEAACNASGTFVKRLIGLPGETVSERDGFIFIDGKRLSESYIQPGRRDHQTGTWHVPQGHYFFMGDNRRESCDSRRWGSVARSAIIGKVFMTYWPPNRISFHAIAPIGGWLGLVFFVPIWRRKRTGKTDRRS